ncbi:MAG TPA: hypothetical protein VE650_18605 [Acetobacteraceae bacterium]|nr:hypothetical protein [Acetobacteraceae bacterium]
MSPASGATPNDAPIVTIGANFAGASNLDLEFIPDTDGAVGPDQFVELLNGSYRVYDKQGDVLQQEMLSDFWTAAGVTPTDFPFDPRVLYDPTVQRWFATSGDGGRSPDSHFLLAVSKTSDPTQGWQGVSIRSDPTGRSWSDFPTLGVNQDGVYLSAAMSPVHHVPEYSRIIAIPKADLLGDTPSVANATAFSSFDANPSFIDSNRRQPAVAFQSAGDEPLLSLDAPFVLGDPPVTHLKVSSIDGPITAPTLDTNDRLIDVPPASFPSAAAQKGTSQLLEVGSAMFRGSAVLVDGDLYAVQHILAVADGHLAVRWFEIGDPLGSPVVLDSGVIQAPDMDFYDASIAVNSLGEAVIGFSGSGPDTYASAYAVAGTRDAAGHLVFGDPILLKAGVAPYVADGERWGDYSATTVDPTDPAHFWTIQEWAAAGQTFFGESVWSTQIAEIIFGPSPSSAQTWFGGVGRFDNPANWSPPGPPAATDSLTIESGKVRVIGLTIDNPDILLGAPGNPPNLVLHDATLGAATHLRVQAAASETPQPEPHATLRIIGSAVEQGSIEVGSTATDVHQLLPAHLAVAMAGGSTFTNAQGAIWFSSDGSTVDVTARGPDAVFVNDGQVEAFGGTVRMDVPVTGQGSFDILYNNDRVAAGAVEFGREVGQGQTIELDAGLLRLDRPAQFHGTILGFDAEGTIALAQTEATALDYADGVLTVSDASGVAARLAIAGDYATEQFALSQHDGDALITVNRPAASDAPLA